MRTDVHSTKWLLVIDRDQVFFAAAAVAQILVFIVIYLTLLRGGHQKPAEQAAYILFFLAIPVVTLIAWAAAFHIPGGRWSGIVRALPWLLLMMAVPATIVAGGLINIERVIYYSYDLVPRLPPFSVFRFLIGAGLGALLFVASARSYRSGPLPRRSLGAIAIRGAGAMLLLSLFDPHMMVDTISYGPYAGPALAMRYGAVPMVDAFSQYGLNFVLFGAAFSLAQTLYMAAFVVAALNVVMGFIFAAIATGLGHSRQFAFVAGVFFVLFLHAAFLYNITDTPSVFAMRFLPPFLLVATLVRIPNGQIVTWASASTMALCSLWSLEAFVSAFMVYAVWLAVHGIGERQSPQYLLGGAGLVCLLALAPHGLLTLAYLAAFGTPPRYDIYLELVSAPFRGSYWQLPVEDGVYAWILFGFVYASALAFAGYKVLSNSPGARKWAGIAALSALGVLQFYYYVGRSATPVLVFVAMPMMLLVLLACDWSIDASNNWRRTSVAMPILALPTLIAGLILFIFMGATSADRLFETIRIDLPSSTLLRACLPGGDATLCSLRHIVHLIRTADTIPGQYPNNETGGTSSGDEDRTEFKLLQDYTLNQGRRVLLFGTDPVPVIFYSPAQVVSRLLYPPIAIGITDPIIDGLSPTLASRALATSAGLHPGDVVIIGDAEKLRHTQPTYELDLRTLAEIEAHWTLCPKESIGTVQVFELAASSAGACN